MDTADPVMAELRPVQDLIPFATELAAAAGQFTERYFRSSDLVVETKGDGSPVTVADRGAEELMRQAIRAEFPADGIIGEEFGTTTGDSTAGDSVAGPRRRWVIDPIDGTKSFTAGVPLYSNLLAVVDDGVPVLGVINLPALGEMVWAAAGHGAFCNDEPSLVSQRSSLDGAYVMTSGVDYWPRGALDDLSERGTIIRTWGDAYGYALVATGRADAMVDPIVSIWDVAPMVPIMTEAGGRFTDLAGNERIDSGSGIGTNAVIHNELLAALP